MAIQANGSIGKRASRTGRGCKTRKCGRLVGYHRFLLMVFIQVACNRLGALFSRLAVEVPDTKNEGVVSIVHVRSPGHSETKSKNLTGICMWAKMCFFQTLFSFFLGHFRGGIFLGK